MRGLARHRTLPAMKALLRSRWMLLVWILLIVKGALVLSLSDVFFYGEELEKGTAAKAMIDGLGVPHHQLAYHYYEGGGFVVSHLAAVAFLVVGQNLLAHKLVAMAFQIAILLAGCELARRLFSRPAAMWFGLLFIFAPESYQKLSLINLGIHFEACLFLFLVLSLGGRILFDDRERLRDWFVLGVVTGLGLYFSYQVALAAAWVALLLLVTRSRELFGLRGLAGLIGTAVGALPLFVMYSLVGDAVFDIHGTPIAGNESGPSNSVLFREFLASIFIDGDLGERVTPFAWAGAFLAATIFLLRRPEPVLHPSEHSRKHATLYVLGYMLLFLVVYLSSGFVQGRAYHFSIVLRLVPLWVLAALLAAAALGELTGSLMKAPRRLAVVLGVALLAIGVRSSLSVLRTGRPLLLAENWRILTHHKGYSYDQYFAKVMPHFAGTREERLELVEGFDEEARGLLRADAVKNLFREELLAEHAGTLHAAWASAVRSFELLAEADTERRAQYELGLGALLTVGHGWNRKEAFATVVSLPASKRAAIFEALGRFGGEGYPFPPAIDREVTRTFGVEGAEGYLRGLGRWAYLLRRLDPESIEEVLQAYPEDVANELRAGFEVERAWNLIP